MPITELRRRKRTLTSTDNLYQASHNLNATGGENGAGEVPADGKHVFISYCSAYRGEAMGLEAQLEGELAVRIEQKGHVADAADHEDMARG